ncbi:N-acetylglucosaminylphosphatidylinositol deacetylase [Beggiatoa sp. PS]|nr:N-acetylglucosaminylphosphatidylinositol deacetylase [Beggiatoa sp. PS]
MMKSSGVVATWPNKKSEGASVYVVIVSDGALNLPKGHSSQIRQSECQAGLAHLEIKSVQFWFYPDGQIPLSGTILEDYRRVVNEIKPTQVLLPHTQESHPDHIRVTRGFLKALEGQWQGQLLFYETVKPVTFINYLFDITVQLSSKRLAMQAHVSQLRSYDYVTHIQTLARLRGLQANVTSAEAFARYEWDGSYQHFFENRPLISVIIHANDMSYLQNALLSLIHQSYDQLEVIFVWFGVEEPILEIDTKNPRKPPKVESSPLENKKNPRKFPFTKMGNSPFGKARNPPRFPFTNPKKRIYFFNAFREIDSLRYSLHTR